MAAQEELNIVSAEKVIKLWCDAMDDALDRQNTQQRQVRGYSAPSTPRKRYTINWSRIKIRHESPQFSAEVVTGMKPTSGLELESTINNQRGSHSLQQKFTARRSESCSEVRFHEGLVVPKRSILPMPPNMPGGMELVVEGMEARLEDEMTWQLENTVTAGPNENLKVKTTVLEKKWQGDFTVTTKISGKVVVSVFENNEFKRTLEGNIAEIFGYVISVYPERYANFKASANMVMFQTSGFMRCKAHVGLTTTSL